MKKRLLTLDTASPTVSLAAGNAHGVIAEQQLPLRQSSEQLFTAIDDVLAEAKLAFSDLDGIAVLRGPGSFTGLRVGLAAVLGFHQATGVAATALPTLPILARAAQAKEGTKITAAVNALRGDWYAQTFSIGVEGPKPLDEAGLRHANDLATPTSALLIGFGMQGLKRELSADLQVLEPPPLARTALEALWHREPTWDASLLTRPIYFREPAVTLSKNSPQTSTS